MDQSSVGAGGGDDEVAGSGEKVQSNTIVAVEGQSSQKEESSIVAVNTYKVSDADVKAVMDATEATDIPQKLKTELYSTMRRAFIAVEDEKVYILPAIMVRYVDDSSKQGVRFFFRYPLCVYDHV